MQFKNNINRIKIALVVIPCLLQAATLNASPTIPNVSFTEAPLKPTHKAKDINSVILEESFFQNSAKGIDHGFRYQPIEEGGFKISKGSPRSGRHITVGRNTIEVSDVPRFKIKTGTGSGVYKEDRSFPLFAREDAQSSKATPYLGTFRLGVPVGIKTVWLDSIKNIDTEYHVGYTKYNITGPNNWQAEVTIAPTIDFHGFVCKVSFNKPMPLQWQYDSIHWDHKEKNNNQVAINGSKATLTEKNLPNGLVNVAWTGEGKGKAVNAKYGDGVFYQSSTDQKDYYIVSTWGVTEYNKPLADKMMARLDTPNTQAWPEERDRLKDLWFDAMVKRALNPNENLTQLLKQPEKELQKSLDFWNKRRSEFQIKTPNPHVNASINFTRAVSAYNKLGPGLTLNSHKWLMYSHISAGWYGKVFAGDYQTMEDHYRLMAALQRDDGYFMWISPSLFAYNAENNNPYWVDQLWWLYASTGDKDLLKDLWPNVQKAIDWELKNHDPDGDGLFMSIYEYWNGDSNGKGPKAAAPTATAWAMLDRGAKMAAELGDLKLQTKYRQLADKVQSQALKTLWNEEIGVLGTIGANGIWREHGHLWEQFLAINNGMLPADKGKRAMRWIESHYGYNPQKDVHLLTTSGMWPLRWSTQWVANGDNALAALAGITSGDIDYWWRYLKTGMTAPFKSTRPGFGMGISNAGGASGEFESIDTTDPFVYSAVRGLFGIVPQIHQGKIIITPGFPSEWKTAEIKSPLVSYQYQKTATEIKLTITTDKPLVKVVYPAVGEQPIVTAKEKVSVVTYPTMPVKPVIREPKKQIRVALDHEQEAELISTKDKKRLKHIDLSQAYNTTIEKMVNTRFLTDNLRHQSITQWWRTPGIKMNVGPKMVSAESGVSFYLANRPETKDAVAANNVLALTSWQSPPKNGKQHYVFPAAAKISVNEKVKGLWLLMQNYVSPLKNYVPNGEIVLHYASGEPDLIQLIPPYNLDAYFQSFSLEGLSVPLGELIRPPHGHQPVPREASFARAQALQVKVDPTRVLTDIEIRAVISEGVIGLSAITLLPAEDKSWWSW